MVDRKPSTTARAAQGEAAPWSTFYDDFDLPPDLRTPTVTDSLVRELEWVGARAGAAG